MRMEVYLLGQTPGVPSEVEVELAIHRDDTENGASSSDKRYSNDKQLIKYHFYDNDPSAAYDMEFKVWSSFSRKEIHWSPDDLNFQHSWIVGRVYAAKDIANPHLQTVVNMMDSHDSSGTFNPASFIASYPEHKTCFANAASETYSISLGTFDTVTWNSPGATTNGDCADDAYSIDGSSFSGAHNIGPGSTWGQQRFSEVPINIQADSYVGTFTYGGGICTYTTTLTPSTLNFNWMSYSHTATDADLKQMRIFNSDVCNEYGEYRYGDSKGTGSFSGARGLWSTSTGATSSSDYMSKTCFNISSSIAKLQNTSPTYDCAVSESISSNYESVPSVMAGFSGATNFDFSIEYISDDSNTNCASANCFEQEFNMDL